MSTRANIVVTESHTWDNETYTDYLYFYRHSDGYPDGALPLLKKALEGLKSNHLRDNISQFAGWLIVLGAIEYANIPECKIEIHELGFPKYDDNLASVKFNEDKFSGWKVGSIEPTTALHGDIEWLYVIDLNKKEIKYMEVGYGATEKSESDEELIKDVMRNGKTLS